MIFPTRTRLALGLPAIALIFGLAACSGGGAPAGSSPSTDAKPAEGFDAEYDAYHVSFAACMRDEGADYTDPTPGEAIRFVDGADAAFTACVDKLGDIPSPPKPSAQETQERVTEALQRVKCLRDLGFDVPDPMADGSLPELPPEALEAARETCNPDG